MKKFANESCCAYSQDFNLYVSVGWWRSCCSFSSWFSFTSVHSRIIHLAIITGIKICFDFCFHEEKNKQIGTGEACGILQKSTGLFESHKYKGCQSE